MQRPTTGLPDDDVRTFVEELLRTGLALTDLLAGLLESLDENAFEDDASPGEALLDMLVGTLGPVAAAAGGPALQSATALLGAVLDRTIADLRGAAAQARRG